MSSPSSAARHGEERRHGRPPAAFLAPAAVLVALLALPLAALLWRGAGGLAVHIRSPIAVSALKLSFLTSGLSLLVIFVTGTPLAYILARWRFRGRALVELLIDLPIVLPPSVAGLALLLAFGRRGVLGGLLDSAGIHLPFTTAAVVMAQTFVAAPFYVRAARIGFAAVDVQMEESAVTEGANQWDLFRYVMMPLCGRPLFNGLILAWTRALGEFGATILFAGNLVGRTQTMPLAIYLGFERDLGAAIALSVFLVAFTGLLLGLLRRLELKG